MPRIAYIQYTNPAGYPSLEHSSRMLADRGWDVLFLGTGAHGADELRFPSHNRITVKRLSFCPGGWRQKLHYAWFGLWAFGWTLRWRPGWIYASDSLSCPVTLALSFLPGVRVIYHEHDSPAPATSPFARLVERARRRVARRAKLCVLPNERRVELFAAEIGGALNARCVWNCPTKDEVSASRPELNGGDLCVLYHGSIVPSRLPASVLTALSKLPERVRLRIIGYETVGHPNYVRQLQAEAARLNIAHRVEFLGTVPTRGELIERCRRGDIGLAFMPKHSGDVNEQTMPGASNKPFDYLACGLALLVSDLPEWRAMYVDTGHARTSDPDDAQSIAAALRWFLEHPAEMRAMGERGRQRILAEWNYERQFLPVLEWMTSGQ